MENYKSSNKNKTNSTIKKKATKNVQQSKNKSNSVKKSNNTNLIANSKVKSNNSVKNTIKKTSKKESTIKSKINKNNQKKSLKSIAEPTKATVGINDNKKGQKVKLKKRRFNIFKRKNTLLIVIILILIIFGVGVTFSYLVSNIIASGNSNSTNSSTVNINNTTLTATGELSMNENEIYPGHKDLAIIKLEAQSSVLYDEITYDLKWTGTNTFTTPIKYTIYKTNSLLSGANEPSISCSPSKSVINGIIYYNETCTEINIDKLGDSIASGTLTNNEMEEIALEKQKLTATASGITIYYYVILEYPNTETSQNQDKNKSFNYSISAVASASELPGKTITEILATKTKTPTRTIDDVVTTYNSSEIYYDTDNDGTTYYYVGAVNDNWVKFADMYWRIIRVNGDGSIRMIYAGTANPTTDESVVNSNGVYSTVAANTQISGTYGFNLSTDNAYVGYMYGATEASNYADTHANINSSIAKIQLESWYASNIIDTGYSGFISNNAYFCNDRQIATGAITNYSNLGYGTNSTTYAPFKRLYENNAYKVVQTPTFNCAQANDTLRYNNATTSASGSKILDYPVGLITSDEAVFAGGYGNKANNAYYLYTGQSYWTMSPFYFTGTFTSVFDIHPNGSVAPRTAHAAYGLRPVINLKVDTKFETAGNGTYNNPFIVTNGNNLNSEGLPGKTITEVLASKEKLASRTINAPVTTYDATSIYYDTDNDGTTYYYVGAANDNWVKFANIYWRIIRVNGDGSIRLIYSGTQNPVNDSSVVNSNGVYSTVVANTHILNAIYSHADAYYTDESNTAYTMDNTYVGYMYGNEGSNTYANTHSNSSSSNIKNQVESWYATNIVSTGFNSFINNDAYFCNDRSPSTSSSSVNGNGGYGVTRTYYGTFFRLFSSSKVNGIQTPSFICNQANDTLRYKNSTSTATGSKVLDYPVGLITADEAVFAGGIAVTSSTELDVNKSYYLYNGQYYWTMTPYNFNDHTANIIRVNSSGYLTSRRVNISHGVRPVINLKTNTKFLLSGSGTYNNPLTVVGGNS